MLFYLQHLGLCHTQYGVRNKTDGQKKIIQLYTNWIFRTLLNTIPKSIDLKVKVVCSKLVSIMKVVLSVIVFFIVVSGVVLDMK